MAVAAKPVLALVLLSLLLAAASALSGGDGQLPFTLLPADDESAVCRGSVGECLAGDGDAELGGGGVHGRVLAGRDYISYASLRRGNVPCNRRGASYYNCRPGAQANPYSRGCSRITRCRG